MWQVEPILRILKGSCTRLFMASALVMALSQPALSQEKTVDVEGMGPDAFGSALGELMKG